VYLGYKDLCAVFGELHRLFYRDLIHRKQQESPIYIYENGNEES